MEARTKIEEMAQELREKYAAPTEAQAVNYLLMMHPLQPTNNCVIAYNWAYKK